jgi:hypothetical protein
MSFLRTHASAGRTLGRRLLVAMVPMLAIASSIAASAMAAETGPQWAVSVVPSPSNLVPESPSNEVDRLTVDATGGTFSLSVTEGNVREETTSALPYDATAAEVETAMNQVLERERSVRVAVTGGPGGATPYTIEWGGEAEHHNLALLLPSITNVKVDSKGLSGAAHAAALTMMSKGASSPELIVTAINVGGAATDGGEVTLSDALPAGLTPTAITGEDQDTGWENTAGTVRCVTTPTPSCAYDGVTEPGDELIVTIKLGVAGGLPSKVLNKLTVNGGGAEAVEVDTSLPIGLTEASFGVAPGSLLTTLSSPQAGAHPNVTTSFAVNTSEVDTVAATPKDVRFDLPVGLVGNTVGMPRCSMHAVDHEIENPEACPSAAMVGEAHVTIANHGVAGTVAVPVYNIAPAPGEPAAFGFAAVGVPVRLDTRVLSNGDYGVQVSAEEISELEPPMATTVTIWGVPADHNGPGPDRSLYNVYRGIGSFGGPGGGARVALLTSPQQCSEPLSATMEADSWVDPGSFAASETLSLGTLAGCGQLRLSSSFSMVPDTLEAGVPAGYHFDLSVPQNSSPDGLAAPNVKNVTLQLPLGTVVNPSAAWGLKACSNAQFYGSRHPSQESASLAECPREAQVGTMWIKTPALEEALEGQVYLAEPECDPCTPMDAEDGKMVRLFVQAISEGEGGIVVKLEGHGRIDEKTGQITTTFEDNPQLPFSELRLKLAGGSRAVLANPRACGSATSSLDLTPWSTPVTPDSSSSYTFQINENCFGAQFDPSLNAGMPNIQAGAYSPFTLSFGRSDEDQYLNGISVTMPPGLLGNIGSVVQCGEPEASRGTCPAGSLIGHVQVLTGPGPNPFLVSGGQVFLTGGYKGAPYGLSIVVPAVAGPYTLSGTTGRGTVVVRAKIEVDPTDAHLTVTSDPLPSMLDGIPLQLKAVNVTIDRPGFTFNPTDCGKLAIVASMSSTEGMTAGVSSPFQVTNCATLAFKPQFKVSTAGKTSKIDGASLSVKLAYPNAPQGSEANIKSVKVDLPKQLPSRLTTLQKACTAAQFDRNPAGCPAASVVGHAKALTPIIPVALEGPAYFVSHGGEAFPSLIVVLQGYGVTVDLVGATFISKAGITSSTFKQVPDVPIGSFELTLPKGPYSALAANGNLCTSKLAMPTTFVAQNGAEIKQNTPIAVEGCATSLSFTTAIKKRTLTLSIYSPAAGEVAASGKGLTTASTTAKGYENITISLKQKKSGKLKTTVKVVFKPAKGKAQSKTSKLSFKR